MQSSPTQRACDAVTQGRERRSTWSEWTSKIVDVAVHSTISSRLNYMDFSEETTARFNAVAHAIMLSMGAEGPRRTADAL